MFQLSDRARERKVPVTRIGRLVNFGGPWVRRLSTARSNGFGSPPVCEQVGSVSRLGDWTGHRRHCRGGKEEFEPPKTR